MFETGNLRHLPWSELTRRDLEIRGFKEDPTWKLDRAGYMQHSFVQKEDAANISTDLLLHQALVRRGVAMHIACILSIKVHTKYTKVLMREYTREAMPGFVKVTIEQIMITDAEVFARAAEETQGNLSRKSDGSFALDTLLPEIIAEQRISALMFQAKLPANAPKRPMPHDDTRRQPQPKRTKGDGKAAASGQKGRDNKKKKNGSIPMPESIRSLGCARPFAGRKFCYAYNIRSGCRASSGKCDKGEHACTQCGSTSHILADRRC